MVRGASSIGGTARVEEKYITMPLAIRLMAVAKDQNVAAIFGKFAQNPFRQSSGSSPAMHHADSVITGRHNTFEGQERVTVIKVAAHGKDRFFRETIQDIRVDQIAGMEDQFDLPEWTGKEALQEWESLGKG